MVSLIPYDQLEGRRVGFNIDAKAVADWSYLHSKLRTIQPRFNLVMDNVTRTVEVANMLPNSIVSGRFYHPDDTKFWTTHDSYEAVNFMVSKGAHPHRQILWECNCEPQVHNQLKAWLNWEIHTAREAARRKMHYVTAIAVAKTIEKADVEAGIWDEFIRELHTNEYFRLGVHEYGEKEVMGPYMAGYPHNLINGDALNPANWPTGIPHGRVEVIHYDARGMETHRTLELPNHWHLWRIDWLQIRSVELGYGRIPYFWSEGIHDNMDDVANQNLGTLTNNLSIKEFLKTWNNGKDVKGIPSLAGPWAQTLIRRPDISMSRNFEDIAALQIEWTEKETPPECVGISLFSYTLDENWIAFRLNHLKRLHGHMERLPIRKGIGTMTVPPKVETPTELTRFMINTTEDWRDLRVRAQPTLSGAVVGNVPDGPIEAYCYVPSPAIERDGYSWVYVSFETGTEFKYVSGWSAAKRLSTGETCLELKPHPKETGEVPAVDPPEEPEPPTEPDEPTQEPPTDEPTDETPTEPDKPIYGPVVVVTDLDSIDDEIRSNLARYAAANVIALLDLSVHHISAVDIIEFAKKTAKERGDAILAAQDKASSPETVTL